MIPLDAIDGGRYGKIICYPRLDAEELRCRLKELRDLKVSGIEFSGRMRIFGLNVLGKGHASIVVVAHANQRRCALKIRRTDADRPDMSHEAELLRAANAIGVGPKLYNSSKNFILMELIEGIYLPEWIVNIRGEERELRRVLRSILEDCWRLDKAGIDHGELSRASRHIIVERGTPRIIDFESASIRRRTTNVTSICQFLFLSSKVSKSLSGLMRVGRERLIEALRAYKTRPTRERLERILDACGINTPYR